ncbi:MAG: hypothetical protein KatS3mg115_1004 [Candidatus Poribacteria bacterium]|nr:MAG: hypothetical protein KatS3mg115_1004 [Candidatus Poribacteria bacterium]
MYRQLLKSKIHRATVTDANLHYEGSITVDRTLMEAADLVPYERVQVLNVYNGARFETYVIPGEPGSGEVCVNGAAARLVHPGDLVLILSYLWLEEQAARSYKPKIVHVDEKNRILVPTQS